jgi:hypothetical protein
LGKSKGHLKAVIAVVAIIAIVAGGYLVLAMPSVIVERLNTVSGLDSVTIPFSVGFPKGSIQVSVSVQGTGVYSVDLLNSTGDSVWKIALAGVPASLTTTESAWMPASGNYSVVLGYWATMNYTVRVSAKGAPF